MRQVNRWLAILLIVMAPVAALAQGGGDAREEVRDSGQATEGTDDAAGSALPRFPGDERHAGPQRVILVMLMTLVAATMAFGLGTVAYAFRDQFRDQWIHRFRP